MKCRYVHYALIFVFLAAINLSAQEKPKDEVTASPAEKAEAQALAKRFVKRLGQTHDVTPLIREFYAHGFAECCRQLVTSDMTAEDKKRMRLTSNDLIRAYVAMVNLQYLSMVSDIYDRGRGLKHYDPIESAFPPRLQKKIEGANPFNFGSDEDLTTGENF
jgi:hypothetical protein